MKKLSKKLFGGLKMNWLNVVLFALATGVYSGIVMVIPFLNETSFRDIGISFEFWVVFAVIVVVNCEKWWDAMLKCFAFFLISQPICYLVQLPFSSSMTFQMAMSYYFGYWFKLTLLTLPGGAIAYFCKKQNLIGSIILGLGNSIQAIMALSYCKSAFVTDFPHHILTFFFCIFSIIFMTFGIQKEKKHRITAVLIPIALMVIFTVFCLLTGRTVFM